MAEVKFHKVTTLPGTLDPDAWYLVSNGSYVETYVTNHTGTAKMVGNSTMINDLIAAQLTGLSQTYIVADITARNSLGATLTKNAIVQVINATGDSTVSTGGATYLYNSVSTLFIKVSEFESMDVVLSWSNISGKPTSTPGNIDLAVTNSHTHSNKSTLDLISTIGGVLSYNGDEIKNWNTVNW